MGYSLLIPIAWILLGRVEGIVNGSLARLGEFPHMVAIIHYDSVVCGGALISDRHVLTAAHCVTENFGDHSILTNLTVELGMINRTDPNTRISIELDRVTPHPDYVLTLKPLNVVNDIAVLTLRKSVRMSKFVKPIGLPKPMDEYLQDTQFTFSGFGSTSFWSSFSNCLLKLRTRAVGRDKCQVAWPMHLAPSHLCAVSTACYGDSGGPLIINGKVVVGIDSAAYADCDPNKPNIHTKVSHYMNFIRDEMKPRHEKYMT